MGRAKKLVENENGENNSDRTTLIKPKRVKADRFKFPIYNRVNSEVHEYSRLDRINMKNQNQVVSHGVELLPRNCFCYRPRVYIFFTKTGSVTAGRFLSKHQRFEAATPLLALIEFAKNEMNHPKAINPHVWHAYLRFLESGLKLPLV